MRSRRLPVSPMLRVDDSPYQWCRESTTPHIGDTGSFSKSIQTATPRVTDTESRRLTVSLIRGVVNSLYHRFGESPTPRLTDAGGRRLSVSPMRGAHNHRHFSFPVIFLIPAVAGVLYWLVETPTTLSARQWCWQQPTALTLVLRKTLRIRSGKAKSSGNLFRTSPGQRRLAKKSFF